MNARRKRQGWTRGWHVLGTCWLAWLALLPGAARAWGHQGHAVVGAIADQLLTPQAQAGLRRDLGLTLAQAGPWADCAKGVNLGPRGFEYMVDERWASPACTRFETPAGIQAMQDFVARNWDACGQRRDCHKAYHYTDVAYQRDRYKMGYTGTNDHDLVQAVNAAIAELQGRPVPPPFNLKSRAEALLLLAHLVGDLHQPLHVGTLYLDADAQPIDPDVDGGPEAFETRGGNSIELARGGNLHALWDDVPDGLRANAIPARMLQTARKLRLSRTPPRHWAQTWASDTLRVSHQAFDGLALSPVAAPKAGRMWSGRFVDEEAYQARRIQLQTLQLSKAGGRLAQLVNALYASKP